MYSSWSNSSNSWSKHDMRNFGKFMHPTKSLLRPSMVLRMLSERSLPKSCPCPTNPSTNPCLNRTLLWTVKPSRISAQSTSGRSTATLSLFLLTRTMKQNPWRCARISNSNSSPRSLDTPTKCRFPPYPHHTTHPQTTHAMPTWKRKKEIWKQPYSSYHCFFLSSKYNAHLFARALSCFLNYHRGNSFETVIHWSNVKMRI